MRGLEGQGIACLVTLLAAVSLSASAGAEPCPACPGDADGSGQVTIDELVLAVDNALAGCPSSPGDEGWVATWSASPVASDSTFGNVTLRSIVRTSVGGDRVRVELSNAFGAQALRIGAARIARRADGAAIVAESDRVLTFGGAPEISVPPGAVVISDPVAFDVPPLSDLAVSIFLPEATGPATMHFFALETSYASAAGDFSASIDGAPFGTTTTSWFFLTAVEVRTSGPSRTIAAFGDSITDGLGSTLGANNRWPNQLARRLQAAGRAFAVADKGIAGNRVLYDGGLPIFGQNGLARFDRDVLALGGVSHVIVLLGINDIGLPGSIAPAEEVVTPDEITSGHQQLIARARARGLKIFGGTLTPFEGSPYYSAEKEADRKSVNEWIRTSGAYDAVIDFDAVVRDPNRPARLLAEYDSGDFLHLSDAGYRAMGDAVDLGLFDRNGCDGREE